jgi:transposase InsO family protein
MRVHRNAKTTPKARALIVQRVETEGWSVEDTADAFGVSVRTIYKWRARYRVHGLPGLDDRRSTPRHSPKRTAARQEARIVRLRSERLPGLAIAQRVGVPRATVGAVLRRHGLGRLPAVAPTEPVRRYERARPGELLHVDIKSLGRIGQVGHRIHGDRRTRIRGIGWEHVHVCVDDRSRVAYVELLPTLGYSDAVGFLERAVAWFAAHGVRAERVLTDNGSAYLSRAWRATCARLGLAHKRTRPYRPRTNGKAERFIQTLLREWAYRRAYATSARRRRTLAPWLRYYNGKRPHTALNYRAPITRLEEVAA